MNEPSCKSLITDGKRTFKGLSAACSGSPNSKKAAINCPDTSGTLGQCDTGSTGMGIVSILLPISQTAFSNCADVLTAFFTNTLTGALAFYSSDTTNPADTVDCSSGACLLTTPNCYSGWDDSIPGPSGTASILNGTQVFSCTFINTDPRGLASQITPGGLAFAAGLGTFTAAAGKFTFNSGWVDAQ